MHDLRELLENGALRPVVAERFPLDRIADAHGALEGRLPGDVVVELAPQAHERTAIRAVA